VKSLPFTAWISGLETLCRWQEIAKHDAPYVPSPHVSFLLVLRFTILAADPPAVRPIPPPGIAVPDTDAQGIGGRRAALAKEIDDLRPSGEANPPCVCRRCANLPQGSGLGASLRRSSSMRNKSRPRKGSSPCDATHQRTARGESHPGKPRADYVVRGYFSKIDGSVQPYGLVMPEDWKPGEKKRAGSTFVAWAWRKN
jgi:hypothetical protein